MSSLSTTKVSYVPQEAWINVYAFAGFAGTCALSATCKKLRQYFLSMRWNLVTSHFPGMTPPEINTAAQLKEHYVALAMSRSAHATILAEPCIDVFSNLYRHVATDALATNQDGSVVCSADSDHVLRVWNAQTHEMLFELNTEKKVLGVALSSHADRLVFETDNQEIQIWDLITKTQIALYSNCSLMQTSADTNRLAFVSNDTNLEVLNFCHESKAYKADSVRTAEEQNELSLQKFCSLKMHPSGNTLISGSTKGSLIYWDLNLDTYQCNFYEFGQKAREIQISNNEQWIVAHMGDDRLMYWNLVTNVKETNISFALNGWKNITSFKIDNQLQRVLIGRRIGQIDYWEPLRRCILKTFWHSSPTWMADCLALSPDGKIGISAGSLLLKFWNLVPAQSKGPIPVGLGVFSMSRPYNHPQIIKNGTRLLELLNVG